jgi:hypothetical protein
LFSPPAAGGVAGVAGSAVAGSTGASVGLVPSDVEVAEAVDDGLAEPEDVGVGSPAADDALGEASEAVEVAVMLELAAEDVLVPVGVASLPTAAIVEVWETLMIVVAEVEAEVEAEACGPPAAATTLANAAASAGVSCVVSLVITIVVSFTVVAGSRFSCKS